MVTERKNCLLRGGENIPEEPVTESEDLNVVKSNKNILNDLKRGISIFSIHMWFLLD